MLSPTAIPQSYTFTYGHYSLASAPGSLAKALAGTATTGIDPSLGAYSQYATPTTPTTSASASSVSSSFSSTSVTVVQNDGSWKALLPSQQTGGNYMVTATSGSDTATLQHVTFGDVYFCSGYVRVRVSARACARVCVGVCDSLLCCTSGHPTTLPCLHI